MTVPVPPAVGRDVGWLVRYWAAVAADRPFLTWAPIEGPPATWTRAEFARDVAALAAAFRQRGLRPGDRLALVLPNHPDFLLAWTAAASMGAVAVCLNPGSSIDELRYAGEHSGAVAAVVTADRADDVAAAMPGLGFLAVSAGGAHGADAVAALLTAEPDARGRGVLPAGAPASVQYTSGTTARPKGVVWTQANCLWAGQVGAAHQGLGPSDVNLVHLPLFHTNALSYSFLASLWSGGQVVLVAEVLGVPLLGRLGAARRHLDVGGLLLPAGARRPGGPGRAPLPRLGRQRLPGPRAASPAAYRSIGWFGMTETVSHPVVGGLLHPDRAGSMGRPAPEYEVAVLDDDGGPVEPGASGTLHVRGRRGSRCSRSTCTTPRRRRGRSPPTAGSSPATGCGSTSRGR